jgi:Cu+-exporting ATPase
MIETEVDLLCYHCGQPCEEELIWHKDKSFCCYGCKSVFEIIQSNNLCEYYDLAKAPGIHIKDLNEEWYTYLNESKVRSKLLNFDSDTYAKVEFYIPVIHCISCVWLLEHLHKLEEGIVKAEVNFPRKTVTIDFNPKRMALSRVAALLHSLGYIPQINLDTRKKEKGFSQKPLVMKLAIAGFCFGNVMLFSFPEYLGIDYHDQNLMQIFPWLNWALALPVFFYSGFDYLQAAFKSFRQKQINIDVPIAAGLMALFFRSSYDIFTSSGPGYLDSFTGLVFFLLIGRWFQGKTYESLAFDRDFKSYFPLAVHKRINEDWIPAVIYELKVGDHIRVRNSEVIPADARLIDDRAFIDYSFVTGESRPAKAKRGDLIYAGGRLLGSPIELIVEKLTTQSHLTSLWNHEAFRKKHESHYQKIIDRSARLFTWIVLGLALFTAAYWQLTNPSQTWLVLTSVLMVACPCALALAAPFTYGSMLRVFGRNKLYLKNADVIERIAGIDAIVFDKTGTLTYTKEPDIQFHGELTEKQKEWIKVLSGYSTHPLSTIIHRSIHLKSTNEVMDFMEIPGQGLQGEMEGHLVKLGSASFTGFHEKIIRPSALVFVSIDGEMIGYFSITVTLRSGIAHTLKRLRTQCKALLSGDHDTDREQMKSLFAGDTELKFDQTPHDKLEYISRLQHNRHKVMMIGDGLNDAGAMKQSDVGIAVTDDTGTFTPACDGILEGDQLKHLDRFLSLAKSTSVILKVAFGISFFYNAIALSVAMSGHLTPLVAAILMPISSISVVGFSSLAVRAVAHQKLKTTD